MFVYYILGGPLLYSSPRVAHHHKNYWILLLCYVSEPRLHEHGFLDILVRDSAKIELGKKLVKKTQIILFMEHP